MATAAAPPATPEEVDREAAIAGLKAKAQLRGLLKSTLRVTLSDGRVVTGQYEVGMGVGGLGVVGLGVLLCVYAYMCV